MTRPGSGRPVSAGSRRRLAVLVAVTGLAALLAAQLGPNRHRIEDDLTRRSAQALVAAGEPAARVSFTGRDALVVADSPADAARAREIVAAVTGVRSVRTEVDPTEPASAPPIDPASTPPTEPASGPPAGPAGGPSTGPASGPPTNPADTPPTDPPSSPLTGPPSGPLTGPASGPPTNPADTPPTSPASGPPAGPASGPSTDPAGTPPTESAGSAPAGPVPTPPTGPVRTPPTAGLQAQLSALPPLTFRTGSAALSPASRTTLLRIAALLKANPTATVRIDGHTDSRGSRVTNLRLSRERAGAVRAGLRAAGVPADRLTVAGHGETRPRVANDTAAHRAENRRVELTVTR
ncbi:OmpA family protein [Actinoplanes ianthinogenes]|uniref:OmpA family protein n=1 Tax=Actinoplanes ianthinogenes TaxID=122358 RepID=UPI00166FD097|nr:OmpA family protein [Actinoplanes ianthinogenes]